MKKIKMNKWGQMGLLSAMVVGLIIIANAAMAADSAVWTTVNVNGALTENLSLNVEEQLRFSDVSSPSLARQHTDINVGWRINDILTTVSGYRNTSTGEHRPYVGVELSLLSGDLDLDNSTKLELRDFDTIRGRTELTVTASVAGVTPWLSDEVFVDESGVTGNRASVGVTRSINDTFSVNAYYLLDSSGENLTSHTHVLGIGLGVSL